MNRVSNLFGRALRETGQALDRIGLTIKGHDIFNETFSRHRPVMTLFDKRPLIAAGAFIAPNASVIGKVLMFDKTSIWYGAVVRGDKNFVKIGHGTNIQDRAVIDTETELESGYPADMDVGHYCTVGHGALLTSCVVNDRCLIGQGAIIQKGCVIETKCIIAAGSVLLPGTLVPTGQLWAGNPAKYIRDVTEEEIEHIQKSSEFYSDLADQHAEEYLPYGTVYQHAEKLELYNNHDSTKK